MGNGESWSQWSMKNRLAHDSHISKSTTATFKLNHTQRKSIKMYTDFINSICVIYSLISIHFISFHFTFINIDSYFSALFFSQFDIYYLVLEWSRWIRIWLFHRPPFLLIQNCWTCKDITFLQILLRLVSVWSVWVCARCAEFCDDSNLGECFGSFFATTFAVGDFFR